MGPVIAPRMPDLEARIREAPRDPAPYLVYADWLQAAGDPRGELIAIQHALLSVESLTALEELRRREEDLLARHQEQIFGAANRPGLAPVLHLGFTTLIGWMDGDGQHGTVVVPDHGWAQDRTHFGNVAVLPDRRIVAIGTRIWLVEDGSVEDLGPSGDYPRPLPITRVDGALRLWSRGPGPVWTSLD